MIHGRLLEIPSGYHEHESAECGTACEDADKKSGPSNSRNTLIGALLVLSWHAEF